MTNYQYQVLRYMPDQFTGEFANVGIVLFAPQQGFLACRVVSRYARLSEFFGEVNGGFLLAGLRRFEAAVKVWSKDLFGHSLGSTSVTSAKGRSITSLQEITTSILPKDDSALQLTEVFYGIDLDVEITLNDLFERIIEKYNQDGYTPRQTDQQAWRNVYKDHFDKYGISKNLKKHVVPTSKDAIEFEKSWKNGVWNCYQPLAFDLKSEDAIKSKVYKWSGIIRELETAKENVHVYFLTTSPKEHSELKSFIRETLTVKDGKLIVDIVEEKEADRFAAKVRRDMEASNILDE
ncbi:MAG TPA: DUF3037 domain-containing protein [Flavisolibacter sp.]|jgi:hypothetical protein|nr:DUF3037 domain-containing protein [Flavisolibacter sp.]